MKYCDIYLFCLWHKSKRFWKFIVEDLKKNYNVSFLFKSEFPKSMNLLKKFYSNVPLEGGYAQKLDDVNGEFLFCIAHDKNMNDFQKIKNLKTKYRSLEKQEEGYRLLHASDNIKEFTRQLRIIEELVWQQVIFI